MDNSELRKQKLNKSLLFYINHRPILFLCTPPMYFCYPASRWKDVLTGKHVDYDQRPDIFRSVFAFVNSYDIKFMFNSPSSPPDMN